MHNSDLLDVDYLVNIRDGISSTPLQVNCDGALMVEGIENWITGLTLVGEFEENGQVMLRVKDSQTGAVFLIRREK